jgi:Mn-dependent DtxR family transcriptional regulator
MKFELNNEELSVLRVIRNLNDGNEKTDYYQVVEGVKGDTGTTRPIVSRLDDDGYITSSGFVRRYCHITEKGRSVLREKGM